MGGELTPPIFFPQWEKLWFLIQKNLQSLISFSKMMRDIFENFPNEKKKKKKKKKLAMDHRQILLLLRQFKELISIPTGINRKL